MTRKKLTEGQMKAKMAVVVFAIAAVILVAAIGISIVIGSHTAYAFKVRKTNLQHGFHSQIVVGTEHKISSYKFDSKHHKTYDRWSGKHIHSNPSDAAAAS